MTRSAWTGCAGGRRFCDRVSEGFGRTWAGRGRWTRTGLGDKVTKRNKRNKLKLILRDCLRQKSVGVIEEIPEKAS